MKLRAITIVAALSMVLATMSMVGNADVSAQAPAGCEGNLVAEGGTFGAGGDDFGAELAAGITDFDWNPGLSTPGKYAVTSSTDPLDYPVDVFRDLEDRLDPGNGYFAFYDTDLQGADDPPIEVYNATFTVVPNAPYIIEFYLAGPYQLGAATSTTVLEAFVDGANVGTVTVTDDTDWALQTATFTSDADGTVDFLLSSIATGTGTDGADFAIDDLSVSTDTTDIDCDGDGLTGGQGDTDDDDACIPDPYASDATKPTGSTAADCDADGTVDTTDPDNGNPCVPAPYPTDSGQPAGGTDTDCDGDGAVDTADPDNGNACVPSPYLTVAAQPTNGTDGDCDGDGSLNADDTDPGDPCSDSADTGFSAPATNDCDGDDMTVGGGDTNDTDPCIPVPFLNAGAKLPGTSPTDCDGDGTVDTADPDNGNPCVPSPYLTVAAQPTNGTDGDCDGDGVTVGAGDPDDANPCVPNPNGPACDTDGDGLANSIDSAPGDPCAPMTAAGWTAQASNDCDGDGTTVGAGDSNDDDSCVDTGTPAPGANDCDLDGVTVGDGDLDDFDGCIDALGSIPSCSDADGDGVADSTDTAPTDPCAPRTAATWAAQATNDCDSDGVTVGDGDLDDFDGCIGALGSIPSCSDADGDGVADSTDTAPTDPCAPRTAATWAAQATNDCDSDGVTVGGGDLDDFDGCIDALGSIPSCSDADGDGVADSMDTAPTDPCAPRAAAGWAAQASNDCDNDGVTVGDGDLNDFDGCIDASGTAPSCSDADGDGVPDGTDTAPTDPCAPRTAAGWAAQPSNDCDLDGVTVGDGDLDDFDGCIDALGSIPSCSDADGDGVADSMDTAPTDPCAPRTAAGWAAQATNDCDGDGLRVGDGDLDDTDGCVDDSGLLASCVDTDGDGVTDDVDADINNPCIPDASGVLCDMDGDGVADSMDTAPTDPCAPRTAAGWAAQTTNDCDGDGLRVGDGDLDDTDGCVDDSGLLASCVDTDGDGVTDDVDADINNPCIPDASGVLCDMDGDGVDNGVDPAPADPCAPATAAGWAAQATNDCDNDGVTVADGDLNDVDDCQDDIGRACFSIEGRVWFDADRDAGQDTFETDLSGIRLTLTDAATGAFVAEAYTASPYTFTDVRPGSYVVEVDESTLPGGVGETYEEDGSTNQSIAVVITASDVRSQDFGYATAQVCGELRQSSQVVPGTAVTVEDSVGTEFRTTTDAQGNYCVEGTLASPMMAGPAKVSAVIGRAAASQTVDIVAGESVEVDLARASATRTTTPAPQLAGPESSNYYYAGNRPNPNNSAPTATPAPASTPDLAFTGTETRTLASIGVMLLILGGGFVFLGRRREGDYVRP